MRQHIGLEDRFSVNVLQGQMRASTMHFFLKMPHVLTRSPSLASKGTHGGGKCGGASLWMLFVLCPTQSVFRPVLPQIERGQPEPSSLCIADPFCAALGREGCGQQANKSSPQFVVSLAA